ncbi:MAG: LCP family protein [Peptococcaceae bacterium]|nr:LCP family protein [Peptococcaceae bacterium]
MMGQGRMDDVLRSLLIVAGVVFLGMCVGSGIGLALNGIVPMTAGTTLGEGTYVSDSLDEQEQINKRVTFLLLGSDQRPGDTSYRTDTIILASADPGTKIISLLSIPRDSMVLGTYKINSIPFFYGNDMTKLVSVVSDITGVKIDGYVKTDFGGFKDIIDTLGGVDIYVETDMKKTLDGPDNINLKKGVQHLDGEMALQYVRYRDYVQGDIQRTACQQKFLMAVAERIFQPEAILKLPQLIPQLNSAIETDLKLTDLLRLAGMAKNFKSENIISATLPGNFYTAADGLSYWKINESVARKVTADLLKGITTNIVVLGPSVDMRPRMVIQEEQDELRAHEAMKEQDNSQTNKSETDKPGAETPEMTIDRDWSQKNLPDADADADSDVEEKNDNKKDKINNKLLEIKIESVLDRNKSIMVIDYGSIIEVIGKRSLIL